MTLEEVNNRFLIFGYYGFYPEGGMNDCIYKANDISNVLKVLRVEKNKKFPFDFLEVYDIKTEKAFKYEIKD